MGRRIEKVKVMQSLKKILTKNFNKNSFINLYKHPAWQRKRLEILKRDDFSCQNCGTKNQTLHVHHKYYEHGKLPWDYPLSALITLCEICHENESNYDFYIGMLKDSLRDKFLVEHICNLAAAFYHMELCDTPEKVIYVYSWAIGNKKIQKKLIKKYNKKLNGKFRYIKKIFKKLR